MASVSNGLFLPVLPAPPLPGSGWSVKVYAHTDLYAYAKGANPNPIAQISRFEALTWSPEICAPGAGSITLALADPVFSYALPDGRTPDSLWRYSNLWVVFEDGQWRGEFFGETISLPRVSNAEHAGRTVTISGPGAAQCLEWARVLSPYFPNPVPKNKIGVYQYKNQPVMSSWLQLLFAAQQRNTIPWVHCRFSATKDTAGAKWDDTPAVKAKTTASTTVGAVSFTGGGTALTAAGTTAVKTIAGKIAKLDSPVVSVVGHTDSTGSKADNLQTGLDRANTVRNALLALRPELQVTASSKGESQPVASNATAAGRAKNRRVVVTYQSAPTGTGDTVYTPERGTTLLALLQQLTSGQTTATKRGPIHCEWIMVKQFELQVRSLIGTDRSARTVFHEGSTCMAAEDDEYDRSGIANLIAVETDHYLYKSAVDRTSAARWNQRELYTKITGAYSEDVQSQIVGSQTQAYRDEQATSTLSVIPGPYRTPFRDFGLGDKIGLYRTRGKLPGSVEVQRVKAISVAVDADGVASYQITLNSTRAARTTWLQTQIDTLINTKTGIQPFIQDEQPTGALPGDLWTPLHPVVRAS